MRLARKRASGRKLGALVACGAAALLAMALAACGPVSGATSVGTTPVNGGSVTYAMLSGFPANYIFPFTSSSYFTTSVTDDFQYLLYRPLYWFGDGNSPKLNPQLSIAYAPEYSGSTVTIKLKPYKWSNGQPVTAQNIMFWINMTKAEESNSTDEFGGYISGYFPDNVTDIHAVGTNTLVMKIKGAYSEEWFTDNELSQITPMPSAWDETKSGPSHCEETPADCAAVYNFLNKTAVNPTTWGNSPLWSVVDGPWRVVSATNQDVVKMTYNTKYSGPAARHHIDTFILEPVTSEQAEFNQLEDPGNNPVQVGYLPTVDAPVPPAGDQVGSNPVSLSGYKLDVIYPWALSYFPYNFNDPTAGPIFKQLYFRQAFQSLIDQEGVVNGPMHGYGTVTIGPVTDYPATYLAPGLGAAGDQYTLNPSRAEALLRSHGWSISTTGGTDRCIRPGSGRTDCGPGVKAGTKLEFNFLYATGYDWMESQVKELVSNASLVGIKITEQPETSTSVINTVFGGAGSWQLAEWGSWTYAPDYLPTGEELFGTTSVDNAGHYSNGKNDKMITATLTARKAKQFQQAMDTWQTYLADQLPVVWTPNVATLVESVNDLVIGTQTPTLTITPEDWYYVK